MTAQLAAGFAEAAAAGREGAVRELLSGQFPRLAQALEDTLAKLLQDTEVPSQTQDMHWELAPVASAFLRC